MLLLEPSGKMCKIGKILHLGWDSASNSKVENDLLGSNIKSICNITLTLSSNVGVYYKNTSCFNFK